MHAIKVSGKNHGLIAFFKHANSIEEKPESREIGENRVRESYGRNGIELPNKVNRLATGAIRGYGTDQVSFSVPAEKQRDQYKNPREE
jgi:hypothetical protein